MLTAQESGCCETQTFDDGRKWIVRKCIPYNEEPDFTVEFDMSSANDNDKSNDKIVAISTHSPVVTPPPPRHNGRTRRHLRVTRHETSPFFF